MLTYRQVKSFLWKHNAAVPEEAGFEFNPHDLRRTASTHLARLGVREEIREAVLNHKKRELRSVYNLYEYNQEKREALELCSDAVMSAVGPARPVYRGGGIGKERQPRTCLTHGGVEHLPGGSRRRGRKSRKAVILDALRPRR
ncbi:MAG: hypothetical protein ACJ76N_02955 [Thermoanaerobaculia bacterium]